MNPCRNDSSNTVYGGTKSPVSVSYKKKFKPIEIAFNFSICNYVLPQKKFIGFRYTLSLKWLLSLMIKDFYKKFVA